MIEPLFFNHWAIIFAKKKKLKLLKTNPEYVKSVSIEKCNKVSNFCWMCVNPISVFKYIEYIDILNVCQSNIVFLENQQTFCHSVPLCVCHKNPVFPLQYCQNLVCGFTFKIIWIKQVVCEKKHLSGIYHSQTAALWNAIIYLISCFLFTHTEQVNTHNTLFAAPQATKCVIF